MRYVLEGGLGNQIFQYAFYLKVSDENKFKKSMLDTSWYDIDLGTPRQFALPKVLPLNTDVLFSPTGSYLLWLRYTLYRIARKIDVKFDIYLFQKFLGYYSNKDWTEFSVVSDYLNLLNTVFVETHCRNNISGTAVHLRFGDYVNNPLYAVVDYHKILELSAAYSQNNKINVFSDDPELASKYISKQPQPSRFNVVCNDDEISTFVELAHHATIYCSNSTYSYAAALLGPASTIFVPKFWTREREFSQPQFKNKILHTF
ncbi:hypothetical protein N9J60_00610 [Alphaproteobacteria bacterium]|nr:hypothetical protein [Alphaproteobacteria bacterium]